MKRLLLIALYTVGLATAAQSQAPAPQTFKPDAEGFIRNWLVLAPVAIEGESGASEIDRDILKGEAAIAPKAGDKIGVGGQIVGWQAHQTSDYFIDFLQSFGGTRGEYVAGYAVAYINADEEMKVTLALSTNDQGKAWLNGKQVFKFAETRTLEKDTDRTDVTLVKGQNILVLKVINEVNNWQACARFLKNGEPVKNLQITTAPK
jgi:opacity protein-like surface antigen